MGLRVGVLGQLEVTRGPDPIAVAGPRLQAVLGVLALRAGQTVSVAELIDATWREGAAPPTAVKTVRSHIAHLRQTLRAHGCDDALRPSPPGYLLALPPDAVDRFRFEQTAATARAHRDRGEHAEAAERFEAALGYWRGDVLAGCELHGWAAADATRLAEARLGVVEDHLDMTLTGGNRGHAVGELEYLVRRHPFRERLWELLMLALHADGRRGDALAAYQRARSVLRDELGVDPGRRLKELESSILRGDRPEPVPPPARPAAVALAGSPRPRPPGRVPAPVTPLVGRDAAIPTVTELVHTHRLVTLSGTGGCGKTRVAIAAARTLAGDRFDPVVFVDLAPVADPALVALSAATALGVPQHPHLPLADTVAQHYAGLRPLLVLDNCEHLVDACAELVDGLLAGCPELHVLATSRSALGAAGETVWTVPPLPIPPAGATDLAAYGAAELFAQRAGIADLSALTPAETSAVGAVCAAVDGLPLAIELAAARARVLSLPDLAALLTERFDVLAGGPRTARPQHRTLRACVEWSYELLDADEQALLRALAVVSGTCDLPAVAALCPPSESSIVALDLVDQLAGKSLLVTERLPTGTRYRLLDTIRRYVAERLTAAPAESRTAHERHAAHYVWLAEELDARLRGAELSHVLRRFAADHDNLRAAMTWLTRDRSTDTVDPSGTNASDAGPDATHAADATDGMAALRLARALWQYCYLRGHYAEGRRWLRTALAVTTASTPGQLVGAALDGAAALAHYACDYGEAAELGERALLRYQQLGDRRGTALALTRLGSIARERADYPLATRHHRDAMALFEQAGDEWGVGHSLQLLGLATWLSGDPIAAEKWSVRALRALTAVGDKERIAWTLLDRGAEAFYTGDDGAAAGHLETARQLFTEVGFKEGLAWAGELQALVDLRRDDLLAALDRLTTSLRLHHELGDRWRVCSVLESLARIAASVDDPASCGDLLGMAGATRLTIGAPVPHCEREPVRRAAAWLRERTGAEPPGWDGPPSIAAAAGHVERLRIRIGIA